MSEGFDAMKLPGELQDVAGRLRGLRPAAVQANEAECMYRAGWEAALACQAAPSRASAAGWNKSYLGGLISGAFVSGSLAAVLMLALATSPAGPETVPDQHRVAQETVTPAPDVVIARSSDAEPQNAKRSSPPETRVTPERTTNTELTTTALLSPAARRQWREGLTQSALPYASPRTDSGSAGAAMVETLRSSPRDIDLGLF